MRAPNTPARDMCPTCGQLMDAERQLGEAVALLRRLDTVISSRDVSTLINDARPFLNSVKASGL